MIQLTAIPPVKKQYIFNCLEEIVIDTLYIHHSQSLYNNEYILCKSDRKLLHLSTFSRARKCHVLHFWMTVQNLIIWFFRPYWMICGWVPKNLHIFCKIGENPHFQYEFMSKCIFLQVYYVYTRDFFGILCFKL